MKATLWTACFVFLAGCAMPGASDRCRAAWENSDVAGAACEDADASSEALISRGPGYTPPSCSQCLTNYDECVDDAGGDADEIGWCQWELGVCNRHCSGPIVAVHR